MTRVVFNRQFAEEHPPRFHIMHTEQFFNKEYDNSIRRKYGFHCRYYGRYPRVYGIRSRVRVTNELSLIASARESRRGTRMSTAREMEIVRIGRQLEKLANSDTPVSLAAVPLELSIACRIVAITPSNFLEHSVYISHCSFSVYFDVCGD